MTENKCKTQKIHYNHIESVFLQLTSSCNLRCRYCYAHIKGPAQELTSQKVNEVLNALALRGGSTVIFSGGEPTLDPKLPEYLHANMHHYGHKSGIVTNGLHISTELLTAIRECNAFVQFSLDTVDHKTFRYLCGSDKLTTVIENIERMLDAKIEISLSFTATQKNFIDIIPLVKFALSKGITHLHIGNLVTTGRASCYRELGSVRMSALWDILYPIQLEYYEHIGIDLVEEFLLPMAIGEKRDVFCAAMKGKGLEITYSGRVTACGMMPEEVFTYGNINNEDFEDILNNISTADNFDFARLTECSICEARPVCAGGCRAIAFINSGNIYGTYPYCSDNRDILKKIRKDADDGKLDAYLNFLKGLPSEKASSSRYF
jgi:radical SAM protein with 4Fe4S-binding SPASM domain